MRRLFTALTIVFILAMIGGVQADSSLDTLSLTTDGKATTPVPAIGYLFATPPTTAVSWTGDQAVDSYKLYVGTGFPLDYVTEVTGSQYTNLPTPKELTEYFWRVDAYLEGQLIATGDVWRFTTGRNTVFRFPGDLNKDWKVDFLDLILFSNQWLDLPGCTFHPNDCADLTGNDGVNMTDFSLLSGQYGDSSLPRILKINELSASNSSIIADEAGDFDDWIEIYNAMNEPFDIGGMYLSDSPGNLTKWRIPSNNPQATTIDPNGYLLIWADNEPLEGPLHATFQLAAGGDEVILYDDVSKVIIDRIAYDEQIANLTFGRFPDGIDQWEFMDNPTPKAENISGYPGRAESPDFNKERGFYSSPFALTITSDTPGAQIYYSTNSKDPYPGSPGVSLYTEPIPVSSTTSVKAAAYNTDFQPSRIVTHTYIYINDVITHPKMSTTITENPLWGPKMHDALLEIPTISLVTQYAIPSQPVESPPEVPISIEMIYPDGKKGFQVNAGIERFGGQYTVWPKQALRVSFKTEYGPSRLKYDLFGDTPYGGENTTNSFNQIILRNGSHDTIFYSGYTSKGVYTRNRYCFDRQLEMGHPSLRGKFVHVYLNGVYWGMYHLMERPTADFMAEYLGGEEEDYDIMKGRSGIKLMEGTRDAWDFMVNNANNYEIAKEYIDIDNYIDYMLLNFYGGNDHDWYSMHNWVAGRKREAGGKFKFFMWDNDFLFRDTPIWDASARGRVDRSAIDNGGPAGIFHKLKLHEEFRIRMADRAQKHFFNDGMLTPARVQADFTELTNRIERAVIPEYARWTQEGSGGAFTPNTLRQSVNWIKYDWGNNRTNIVIQQMRDEGLFPSIDAPTFSQHGGQIASTEPLAMTAPAGTIWYTTDGVDPRNFSSGGGSSTAIEYTGPISLPQSTHLKARAMSGQTWSALNETVFAVGPVVDNLRITEIMYHPSDAPVSDPNAEYIELKNIGSENINLAMVSFTAGVDFTFPSLELAPGGHVLVVADIAAFMVQYPDFTGDIAGEYPNRLSDGGERIVLKDAIGRMIHDFKYDDNWFDITDGDGYSLTIRYPNGIDKTQWDSKSGWRPSSVNGGTPGVDDNGVVPELGSVKINEILAHSHLSSPDWVELYNTTGTDINIGGWFLSDSDKDDPNRMKYEIAAGTIIPGNGYIVFYENLHFNNPADPGCHKTFALSENGETVYLRSGNAGVVTGYYEEEAFGASERDVTFGRYQKSGGAYNFVAMSAKTSGDLNAYPKVGPVVINEIMYHPAGNADAEYIELLNVSDSPVPLYDLDTRQPWRFVDDGSDSTPGLDFYFPTDPYIILDPNEYLLLVKDLTAFTAEAIAAGWNVPGNAMILEWKTGSLTNSSEKPQISLPGDTDGITRYYIRVDRVSYSDGSHPVGDDPWPAAPDGNGQALSRITPLNYGNDVSNWESAWPTPGR
ncbi:MAG: lamin tail domain-containing protein [Phycisphaerae bacterium]|nr:lamin tail domain-containing protein [Phycisphaerae bacterium]